MQQQQNLNLRDFLNLEANDEIHMLLQGTRNKTPKVKYDSFVRHSLDKFNPLIRNYVDGAAALFRECKTVKEIEDLNLPALPKDILDEVITLIDKQKFLNIVEKTYLFLDLTRAVSTNIGTTVGKAAMHYANLIQMAKSSGGRILGLDGSPLS